MITSFGTVQANPVVMLSWGALIAALLFLAMLPPFLGLFVVLPCWATQSWHPLSPGARLRCKGAPEGAPI